jgi:hypothetical protein
VFLLCDNRPRRGLGLYFYPPSFLKFYQGCFSKTNGRLKTAFSFQSYIGAALCADIFDRYAYTLKNISKACAYNYSGQQNQLPVFVILKGLKKDLQLTFCA